MVAQPGCAPMRIADWDPVGAAAALDLQIHGSRARCAAAGTLHAHAANGPRSGVVNNPKPVPPLLLLLLGGTST